MTAVAAAGPLMACLDVAYREARAAAACVAFAGWADGTAARELVRHGPVVAPYRRGALFERELPLLLAVLGLLEPAPNLLIVDGHVWLDGAGTAGLGGHLFAALGASVPVIGVAKRPFAGAPAVPVLRGRSRRPLWVSAAGAGQGWAAARVAAMHGPYRLPTLLRRADRLARAALEGRPT